MPNVPVLSSSAHRSRVVPRPRQINNENASASSSTEKKLSSPVLTEPTNPFQALLALPLGTGLAGGLIGFATGRPTKKHTKKTGVPYVKADNMILTETRGNAETVLRRSTPHGSSHPPDKANPAYTLTREPSGRETLVVGYNISHPYEDKSNPDMPKGEKKVLSGYVELRYEGNGELSSARICPNSSRAPWAMLKRVKISEAGYMFLLKPEGASHFDDLRDKQVERELSFDSGKDGKPPYFWIDWRKELGHDKDGKPYQRFINGTDQNSLVNNDTIEEIPLTLADAKEHFNVFGSLEQFQEHKLSTKVWHHSIAGALLGLAAGTGLWWITNRNTKKVVPKQAQHLK
jgi:hypothetical protein